MDPDRFDAISRALGQALPRQRILRMLAGVTVAGLSAITGVDDNLAAKKRKRKKGKRPLCDPDSKKKVAMCHCPPGNPDNAHVICIDTSGCGGHGNDLPCDCVCGKVPASCVDRNGNPFPQCARGQCRRNGSCAPRLGRETCQGVCTTGNFPCPTTSVANCRCLTGARGNFGVCVSCPAARICGLACCPAGQICCDGSCVDASTLCGGICGNVCASEETCCDTQCVPTADLCPDCSTICAGADVCCGGGCASDVECCLDVQCREVCQTGVCTGGTCEFTPVPPNEQGPFCNRPGEVCCQENDEPVCCRGGEVCIDSGCCQPQTCAAFPGACGPQDDGCGGQTADCPCPSGQTCGVDGTCFTPQCVPDSLEVACAGLQCGPASNGCGTDYNCGDCDAKRQCVSGSCTAISPNKKKRCAGKGLAGQPCGGKKCKCKGGRRCHNGSCCETVEDGSKHCNANSDCCPGLMCARSRPGQHKVCMRRNAKAVAASTNGSPEQASDAESKANAQPHKESSS